MSSAQSRLDYTSYFNTVNGQYIDSDIYHHGIDPSTRKELWKVPIANEDVLGHAVLAAQTAFRQWSLKSWTERQEFLSQLRKRHMEEFEGMTRLLIKECGKPVGV